MDNLEWNCWNLVLIRLDMKGIFRSVWIVWFDIHTKEHQDGSKDFELKFLDVNYVRSLCRPPHFHSIHLGRRIILYTVSLLSRESLDLLLRRGLKRPNFLLKSIRFCHLWEFHVSQRSRWSPR
jgi:hypothetical protein